MSIWGRVYRGAAVMTPTPLTEGGVSRGNGFISWAHPGHPISPGSLTKVATQWEKFFLSSP
jgi:hypothetical protein